MAIISIRVRDTAGTAKKWCNGFDPLPGRTGTATPGIILAIVKPISIRTRFVDSEPEWAASHVRIPLGGAQ